jgi:hypothetical protein
MANQNCLVKILVPKKSQNTDLKEFTIKKSRNSFTIGSK